MKYTHIKTLAAIAGLALTATSANAALSATYTYDAAGVTIGGGQAALLDAGNLKLTDGVFPISAWDDGTTVGWRAGEAEEILVGRPLVTFNLGGQFDLTTIDVWTVEGFTENAESVTISSSTNGSTWSPTVVADTLDWVDQGVVYGNKVTIDVSSLPTGQFFRMKFDNTSQWTMLTEI